MSDTYDLLISASDELKSLIDDKNQALKAGVSITDLNPPDYYDYQTPFELARLHTTLRSYKPKTSGSVKS